MPALADSPARIVQRTIVDVLGLGTDPDTVPAPTGDGVWMTYYDQLPPQKPDRAIAVVNTLGQSDGRDQRTGELFAHFGFHVTVRAPAGEEAWRRAELIRCGLAEDATGATVTVRGTAYLVNAVTNLREAFRVGTDGGRVRYAVTGTLSVTTDFSEETGTGTGTGTNGGSDGHTILTITDDGSGNALVTCAAPHGLVGGETVTITGTSGGVYDFEVGVDGVPSPTTWFIGGSYSVDATGGTWSLS